MQTQNDATHAPLVVDLNRDLLHGNLGAELFWASVKRDWRAVFSRRRRTLPEPRDLPLSTEVLSLCEEAHVLGGEVILADSGATELAGHVKDQLGVFTAVTSDPAPAPTPTLAAARPTDISLTREIARQLRLHQWVKNILAFLPLLAAHAFDWATFLQACLAFLAFGLVASSVYVLNDLLDLANDRHHRSKRHRPFASGRLSTRFGLPLLILLLVAGFSVAALGGIALVAVLAAYFVLTSAYSFRLKGLLAVDIVVLAALYTMRIIAGAAATDILPSVWLFSFSMFLFLSLAAVKRLAELVELDNRSGAKEAAGRAYSVSDRPIVAMIATSAGFIAVLVLVLYIDSPEVRAQYSEPTALWGVSLLLMFWVSRIVFLAHRGLVNEDPVVFALRDRPSRWVAVAAAILFAIAAVV